jgi:toxin YoeB
MKITFHTDAWQEYTGWEDRRILRKINSLIKDIERGGSLGKPEKLRGDLSGWDSRRITDEHRLVYRVRGDSVEIASCRYHY